MALAGVIGLGVVAGLARAQVAIPLPAPAPKAPPFAPLAPVPPPRPAWPPPVGQVGPGTVPAPSVVAPAPYYDPTPVGVIDFGTPPYGSPGYAGNEHTAAPEAAHPASRWRICNYLRDCLRSKGVGCWSHHNALLCGSWQSECTFIFGSCREFFGEPCLPPPPGYQHGHGLPGLGLLGGGSSGNGGCAHCR
jgi:hypothetical protein